MIEVHPNPEKALSDGPQSLTPDNYNSVMNAVFKLHDFIEVENL